MERLNGIHRDIHHGSRGSRHDDGGGGSRDSRHGDSRHRRRIHILHRIRGRLQEQWLPLQQTLQTKINH